METRAFRRANRSRTARPGRRVRRFRGRAAGACLFLLLLLAGGAHAVPRLDFNALLAQADAIKLKDPAQFAAIMRQIAGHDGEGYVESVNLREPIIAAPVRCGRTRWSGRVTSRSRRTTNQSPESLR